MFLLLICLGCTSKAPAPTINISLVNNNQSLQISGLDKIIITDIARDTANHFESLVPVFRMPADTDMKDYQPIQPGKYIVKDSALIFTPDTPFTKQQVYFVRYFQYGGDYKVMDFVKGQRTATKLRYTDLIFKQ